MTEHDVAHEKIAQHRGADLARESARPFPMHVLRTDLDLLRLAKRGVDRGDGCERRHDHNLHIGSIARFEEKRRDEVGRLALGHVHLPIRGDDFFAHEN